MPASNAEFSTLRAFLFDLDGTLVETHIDFAAMARAMREMAHAAGVAEERIAGRDILGMVDAAVGGKTAGPVVLQLPAFEGNIAHTSAGTADTTAGTVTVPAGTTSVTVQLSHAAS